MSRVVGHTIQLVNFHWRFLKVSEVTGNPKYECQSHSQNEGYNSNQDIILLGHLCEHDGFILFEILEYNE